MFTLSQNKKIILTAVSIFTVSFLFFLLFFESAELNKASLHTDSFKISSSHSKSISVNDPENEYTEYITDESPWFVTSVEGQFVYLSEDFCKLMDKECEELKGELLYNFINAKDLPALVSENSKLFQDNEKVEAMGPFRMVNGEGELIMLFDAIPLSNNEHKLSEILFSVKDLTEQVQEMRDSKRNWIKEFYPKKSQSDDPDLDENSDLNDDNSDIPIDEQDPRLMVKKK